MPLFSLEHSKLAYRLDLGIFGGASAGLAGFLALMGPRGKLLQIIAWAALGLASWTLIEYGLHRFVLHGLKPFTRWHAQHHRRPAARIYSPTLVSITFIVALVYAPAWLIFGPWPACALTFGIVAGDFGYAITHHAIHHWGAEGSWIRGRKRWHGLHHSRRDDLHGRPGCYGVTTSFWDHVFRTAPRDRPSALYSARVRYWPTMQRRPHLLRSSTMALALGGCSVFQAHAADVTLNSSWHAHIASPPALAGAVQINGSASMAPGITRIIRERRKCGS